MSSAAIAKVVLQAALPIAGVLVVGHAGLISIGGEIRPLEFATGLVLIAASFLPGLLWPDQADASRPASRSRRNDSH